MKTVAFSSWNGKIVDNRKGLAAKAAKADQKIPDQVAGKNIGEIKLVASGAGAAALACLNLLLEVGLKRENVFVTDIAGVVYEGRTELMDEDKALFAQKTDLRTLSEVIAGADAFLGLSAGNVLKKDD